MDPGMFRSDGLDKILIILVILGATLGLWKLVEIVIWVFGHLHWS